MGDFERRYFDALDENFSDIKGDIREVKNDTREISKQVQKINSRVAKLEDKVFPAHQETIQQLPSVWRDPQVLKVLSTLGIGLVLVLIIFAGLRGIPLPAGLL